jgi:hypothetical protein
LKRWKKVKIRFVIDPDRDNERVERKKLGISGRPVFEIPKNKCRDRADDKIRENSTQRQGAVKTFKEVKKDRANKSGNDPDISDLTGFNVFVAGQNADKKNSRQRQVFN